MRKKSSLTFFEWKRFYCRLLPSVCVKRAVFSKQQLILTSIVLVTLKEWLVLRYLLDYSHTNVGAKVQPHQPLVLSVSPTQMLKYIRFLKEYCVSGRNKVSTSYQHKLVISMINFLENVDCYPSMTRVGHYFFVRVEITCRVAERHFVSQSTFL